MEISILGLQNAGKTSFVHVLQHGTFEENMMPTVGFNMRKVKKRGVTIQAWDMGGQKQFRGMWERYCRDVTCIVYMVDANDLGTLELTSEELHRVLTHRELGSIPLLILLNKIDLIPETDPNPSNDTASSSTDEAQQQNTTQKPLTYQEKHINEVLNILRYDQITERRKAFIPLSCRTLDGVEQAVVWLTDIAKNKN